MPEYQFVNEAGNVELHFFAMSDAPEIGSLIEIEGERLTRVPSTLSVQPVKELHFVSETLPLNWPYAKRHDAKGRCAFASKAEVDEAVARSAHTQHDKVLYDA